MTPPWWGVEQSHLVFQGKAAMLLLVLLSTPCLFTEGKVLKSDKAEPDYLLYDDAVQIAVEDADEHKVER